MLQSVLSQIKGLKPAELAKELKAKAQENIEHLQAEAFLKKASEMFSHAVALTEEEFHKGIQSLVRKALEGREDVTEAEQIEIACIFSEFEKTPKGFLEYLKARTGFVVTHFPRNLDDARKFKTQVVDALVVEARERLKESGLTETAHNGAGASAHNSTLPRKVIKPVSASTRAQSAAAVEENAASVANAPMASHQASENENRSGEFQKNRNPRQNNQGQNHKPKRPQHQEHASVKPKKAVAEDIADSNSEADQN
jgi:hypothetical protein